MYLVKALDEIYFDPMTAVVVSISTEVVDELIEAAIARATLLARLKL